MITPDTKLEIMRFNRVKRGSMTGNFSMILGDLRFYDCTLFEKDGKRWISLPTRTVEGNGKKDYIPNASFDSSIKDMIIKRILDALDKMEAGWEKENSLPDDIFA